MAPIDFVSPGAFPTFAGLAAEELAVLADQVTVVDLAAGQALFRQGERGEALYLLAAGRVEVLAGENGGPDHCLATLDPGAILGEGAVLIDAPRTATAVALTDARLWEISRGTFRDAVDRRRPWAVVLLLAIAGVLAERLGNVDGRLLAAIAGDARTTRPAEAPGWPSWSGCAAGCSPTGRSEPAVTEMAATRILLVEDNELNRDMLMRRLVRKGYEVVIAVDGGDGVAKPGRPAPTSSSST